jgi:hypothetical protein
MRSIASLLLLVAIAGCGRKDSAKEPESNPQKRDEPKAAASGVIESGKDLRPHIDRHVVTIRGKFSGSARFGVSKSQPGNNLLLTITLADGERVGCMFGEVPAETFKAWQQKNPVGTVLTVKGEYLPEIDGQAIDKCELIPSGFK